MLRGHRKIVEFIPVEIPAQCRVINHHQLYQKVRSFLANYLNQKRKSYRNQIKIKAQNAFEHGYKEGFQRANSDHTNSVLESASLSHNFIVTLRKDALDSACIIAEKIIGRVIKRDRTILSRAIQNELDTLVGISPLLIKINPNEIREIQTLIRSYNHYRWESSDNISIGSAQIVTPHGSLTIDWRQKLSDYISLMNQQLANPARRYE